MLQIPVYGAEKKDGLFHDIRSKSSISYACKIQPSLLNNTQINKCLNKLVLAAGVASDKQMDLHYLDTILVTTGWNKNRDIFGSAPVYAARKTPEHKPFNYQHDQSDIIGHIVTSDAVDANLTPLADDLTVDELPSKFHLLTSSVLYKVLSDEARQERILQTIAEIAEGKWFVSMECLFSDFDYGVINPDGEQRVIARNEETSMLTKYLSQYGGPGKYGDYVLGRYFKNITFCGKGLVKEPANPESEILNTVTANFNGVACATVYIQLKDDLNPTNQEIIMADEVKTVEVATVFMK